MLKKYFILLLLLIFPFLSYSQEGFPVNGVNDVRENHYAFINANIIVSKGDILDMRTSQIVHAFITGREINLNGKQQILYDRFKRKYSN
tara:strand:- start:10299 stop:10565 length:267 start_codon:yes stop_codon:yes gene_type:complete